MITIIHGTDRLSIDERVASLRREVDPTSFSTTIVEDAARNIAAVKAACGALGFFGTGRLIIAYQLLAAGAKRGRRTKTSDGQESAIDALQAVPRETILVIVEDALDIATEREARRVAPDLTIERFDVPRGLRLVEWTSARARHHRAVLGQSEARQLLEALFPGNWQAAARRDDIPPGIFRLDSELAKLAIAAGDQGTITAAHIASLVPGAEAEDFWGITNAIMQGDAARAIIEVERAYLQGSAAEGILGQITSQFEVLAVVSLAGKAIGVTELATASGLSESRLRQSGRFVGTFPPRRIAQALDALRDLDAGAKQGTIDITDSLVPLIATLARGSESQGYD
ncbi:MAG TPA: DNA polymerase III subunit delta [Nitrolancea sp.]|nr:DNA polymerase III subunit delta [Nitrolancea sp.]